ncbi:MAG: NAD(P)H-quinone oxidoreductase [Bacteroidetes bacterium]|nr:NAD(P)H-quinone oxidoreductase [Rhodothermia bacterium]MCS7154226.1 NAD(P)H-quinone oxidoreductase [Bacteroidota bacterium]MCX7906738.1 NAD(P)H-quinone oxidoreductase [Bacteroidota bacterium]MDW8136982.1 NAD(P)H-quinone oxidoreductase [Bacteroidota bacterium]MDW8285147.1 NAD(P)H-quinone oxidoreductase [Bacteroidota bacterium]
MRAVWIERFAGPEGLLLREGLAPPEPGPEQILVRVHASALNRADLLQTWGRYPPPEGTPERIPGLECAGEVVATGPGVRRWRAGDRVMALLAGGGQAEYAVAHEALAWPVPEGMSWAEAAAIPEAFITAWDALVRQARLRLGQSVLIHAVGSGVGLAALQIARLAGARSVYGTASAPKLERARSWGLTEGWDYRSVDFVQALREREPEGVSVVLDCIGGPYWMRNLEVLQPKGHLVLLGTLGGAHLPQEATLGPLITKRLRLIGTVLRTRPLWEKIAVAEAFRQELWPLLADGRLRPTVDRAFAALEVQAAYRYMAANANFGKIVLLW